MYAKTGGWESYTDAAGRRHWRWPAADRLDLAAPLQFRGCPRPDVGTSSTPSTEEAWPTTTKPLGA